MDSRDTMRKTDEYRQEAEVAIDRARQAADEGDAALANAHATVGQTFATLYLARITQRGN